MVSQNKQREAGTEAKILNAARKIFQIKGLAGARMQEIADEAGINKAMLHYYYRNKDQLFQAVFSEAVGRIFPIIVQILSYEIPLFDKIRIFVKEYIGILKENPYLPGFVLNEITHHPDKFRELFFDNGIEFPKIFYDDINKAIEKGEIIEIEPLMLLVNIIALCVFPIVAKPVVKGIYNLTEDEYNTFLEKREYEVADFIINSISLKK